MAYWTSFRCSSRGPSWPLRQALPIAGEVKEVQTQDRGCEGHDGAGVRRRVWVRWPAACPHDHDAGMCALRHWGSFGRMLLLLQCHYNLWNQISNTKLTRASRAMVLQLLIIHFELLRSAGGHHRWQENEAVRKKLRDGKGRRRAGGRGWDWPHGGLVRPLRVRRRLRLKKVSLKTTTDQTTETPSVLYRFALFLLLFVSFKSPIYKNG